MFQLTALLSNFLLIAAAFCCRSFDSDINDITHRPVIHFKREIYEASHVSKSQDNVVTGVYNALYR